MSLVTALLSVYHWGLSTVCSEDFHLHVISQLIKMFNSTERGALFRHFCVSKVITTAHAHQSGVIFHFFPRAFTNKKKKFKALQPKMTKLASRGSCLKECAKSRFRIRFGMFSFCHELAAVYRMAVLQRYTILYIQEYKSHVRCASDLWWRDTLVVIHFR